MEGTIIRILLGAAGGKSGLLTCIGLFVSRIFYSGITPSATGGQPMQLYEMKRDGNSVSSGTVVLMVTAVCYKLVLVCIGTFLLFQGECCGNILADISVCIFWAVFESGDPLVVTGMIVLPQWIIAGANILTDCS
ncbi:MAG: lysylphosphatidylglycerol synthase domain-containing protein [Gallintestinimicrobium sp.]